MEIISGIYKIEDVETGVVYVGRADSDNGIKKRWSCHKAKLRGGKHEYPELQEAFDNNKDRIKWEILEPCSDEELVDRENYWMDYCDKIEGWHVINKHKKGENLKKVKDKTNMIEAQTGERNGHCTKLDKQKIFRILDMLKAGVSREAIAAKYDIYPAYICRLGKDRWVKAVEEYKNKKVDCTAIQPTSPCVTVINTDTLLS